MPSAFFETPLQSLLVWHKVDTVVITGGSTSGCVRATAVDALSYGFRTIVPIETCADKHESYHFANLTDLQLKYADVEPVQAVRSEERRVGKECVSTCRFRWSPNHSKKKHQNYNNNTWTHTVQRDLTP